MDLIIKSLDLSDSDIMYDLGSGDGKVVLRAALNNNTKVVGIEIHPLLVMITYVKKWLSAKSKNIEVRWQSIFKSNIQDATVIYLYIGPFVMNQVMTNIKTNTPKKLRRVVSYMYPFPSNGLAGFKLEVVKGKNKVYILKKE
jgi:predicted RNA methylase